MYVIQRILYFTVLLLYVSAIDEESNVVGGYVAGISGMPNINKNTCINNEIRNDELLSTALECARMCRTGEAAKTCYYKLVIERYPINGSACDTCTPDVSNSICPNCQCVPGDGVQRMALVVNRMLPGPSIQLCLGDKLVVDVQNKIKEDAVTIHWHGIFQKGSQYYDGVPSVTQCPIAFGTTFRYQFVVGNSGSHFWHAHTGLHKMDGIQGSLVVRKPIEQESNGHLYDYDLANHILFISDWLHEEATEEYPGRPGGTDQLPDGLLINGKGRSDVNTPADTRSNTLLNVITVEANNRYRFRLINSFCAICAGQLTIENHNLTVIAIDGLPVKPVQVDSIISFAAERYDFVIETNQEPGAYWIQVRLLGACTNRAIQQLAVLQYLNTSTIPTRSAPTYNDVLPANMVLNPIDGDCRFPVPNAVCISELKYSGIHSDHLKGPLTDISQYLSIGFNVLTPQQLYRPNNYQDFLVVTTALIDSTMNNITFRFPPSPPLSQLKDLPSDQFCDINNLPSECSTTCTCTHLIKIPLGSLVEVILVDESRTGLTHPFHLHGYAFTILSMGQPLGPFANKTGDITADYVRQLDADGQIERNFDSPPKKDTVPVPNNGYVIFRFRANNPGYWMFHCHFVYHQVIGMEIIVNVGNQSDLPPVPRKFPKCGNFMPQIQHLTTNSG